MDIETHKRQLEQVEEALESLTNLYFTHPDMHEEYEGMLMEMRNFCHRYRWYINECKAG